MRSRSIYRVQRKIGDWAYAVSRYRCLRENGVGLWDALRIAWASRNGDTIYLCDWCKKAVPERRLREWRDLGEYVCPECMERENEAWNNALLEQGMSGA